MHYDFIMQYHLGHRIKKHIVSIQFQKYNNFTRLRVLHIILNSITMTMLILGFFLIIVSMSVLVLK